MFKYFLFLLVASFPIQAQSTSIQLEYDVTGFGKYNSKGILHYYNGEAIFFVVDPLASERTKEKELKEITLNKEDILKGIEIKFDGRGWTPPFLDQYPQWYTQTSFNDRFRLSRRSYKALDKEVILKENTGTIKWNLQAESKIINSFNCQKAIGKFGGRDHIVWYTNEIPVPIGPWKIDGLPGTVVSGISQDDRVSFSLSKVTHDISWPEIEKLDPKPDDIINCDDDFRLFNQENEAQIKKLKSKMPRNITIAGITVDYDRIQKECDQ